MNAFGIAAGTSSDCFACMTPTDSGLATEGEAEWHIAFATALGVPQDQAALLIQHDDGTVRDGRYATQWRVCTSCAAASRASFPAPVLLIPGAPVPVVSQPWT